MAGTQFIVPVQATGTITVTNYATIAGAATVTINGIVLTNGVEWSNATGNGETATSIAAAITTATATTLCTAAATANVVTITYTLVGSAGNSCAVATSDAAKLLKSAAVLSGGSSGIVGTSGEPEAIFTLNVLASTSACTANLYNGTTNANTLVIKVDCAKNARTITKFARGVVFPSGLFVDLTLEDVSAPPTQVAITYEKY